MTINFPEKLNNLAKSLEKPIYAVGGVVRNFLIDKSFSYDVDLAGAISPEHLLGSVTACGFTVTAKYNRTGTVVFTDGKFNYEYTEFRKESYIGGKHQPELVVSTDSIEEDARRRDFKCNAVYYDLKNQRIVDVLGGVVDIQNRVLDTVIEPEKVFSCDGLRLMRLARFSAELNFKPKSGLIESARTYADNVKDVSKERIYAELKLILYADKKYPFSDKTGHYTGLKILDRTRVLDRIIPELTLGRGMAQREDYHNYDVLEHSLKTVLYAEPSVRFAGLLHDVAKPFCKQRDGAFKLHAKEGARMAEEVAKRLKVDKKTIRQVGFLAGEHMVDLDLKMRESKVRKYIVKNLQYFPDLMAIKQADYQACKDQEDVSPTVKKWQAIYEKMISEKTPFSIKDLAVSAKDVIKLGYSGAKIKEILEKLFIHAVINPKENDRETLLKIAEKLK